MIGQELVHGLRSLRRARGFSLLAIATLALGIGANTAIFGMVDGVLLEPLPYGAGARVVHIEHPAAGTDDARFSIPEIADLRREAHSFDAVVEYHSMAFLLYGYGDPRRVQTGVVSDDFFQVLGVRPLYGRLFRRGEEAVGAPPVVLLSYRYWVNEMGADPHAVGSTFIMNDRVHTVVGVLPPLPTYPDANDIWMPAGACPFRSAPAAMASRTARLPTVFARLRPGVTLAAARSELRSLDARFREDHPEAYPAAERLHSSAQGIREEMTAGSRPALLLLYGTALFLLIAAAANFASLTLTRQTGRARELALREALGAGAWRLYRQLALESLLLTGAGGALGLGLAAVSAGLLRTLAARLTPRAAEVGVHPAVIAYAVALCVFVALAAAAVPFASGFRRRLGDRLRQGNSAAMGSRADGRLRHAFVAAQVAVAVVLLIGAGLVGRSLMNLQAVNGGFEAGKVITARLPHNFTKYPNNEALRQLESRLLERLQAIRGARAVAISSSFPLNGAALGTVGFRIAGQDPGVGAAAPKADATSVSPGYFAALGIPLLRGRLFTDADRDTLSPPIIVSRRLAARSWKGRDPVGTTVTFDDGKSWSRIIGVVGDVRQEGLGKDITDEVYVPAAAVPPADIRVLIRAAGPTAPIVAALRAAVHAVDDHEPVASVRTLEQVRGAQLLEPRLRSGLVLAFSVLALILAAAGLVGVVAYTVSRRFAEIAIRLALGAEGRDVLLLVSREGMGAVAIGLVAGMALAAAMARLIRGLLFGVQPGDALTYSLAAGLVLLVAAVACMLPARRALAADPARALRAG